MRKYGSIKAWYIPKGIANLFSMQQLEKLRRIMYSSWERHYTFHMPSGPVMFFKDEQGLLPYIKLNGLGQEAAIMLLETAVEVQAGSKNETSTKFLNVQMVQAITKATTSKRCVFLSSGYEGGYC
jgi:hypothetical protein